MILTPLFHWSPSSRRADIFKDGLVPFSRPVVHGDPGLAAPYICLSPRPSAGWALSGDMEWVSEIEDWDCWQVEIPEKAEVHVRPNYGPVVEEVKVYTAIPAANIWLIGMRAIPVFVELARG